MQIDQERVRFGRVMQVKAILELLVPDDGDGLVLLVLPCEVKGQQMEHLFFVKQVVGV